MLLPCNSVLLLLLLAVSHARAVRSILAATRTKDFSADVETLWQQAEQGIFRKDENGNFERFLRNLGKDSDMIRHLATLQQLQVRIDLLNKKSRESDLIKVDSEQWDAALERVQGIVKEIHSPNTIFRLENEAEQFFAKILILNYHDWPERGRAPAGIDPEHYHPSTSWA